MTCRDCQDQLIEYLDGTLPREAAEAIQSHLTGCPACRQEERSLVAVLNEARAPLPEPSDLFWTNFLPRVRERIATRPEPWYSFLSKPAVGWGSLSLATLMVLAGLLFWRMAPTWRSGAPAAFQSDDLSYETGYPLDDHLAQVVETSRDQTGARQKVFDKLSPDEQDKKGEKEEGDLDDLLDGLSPEQQKQLEQKIKELEAKVKEA